MRRSFGVTYGRAASLALALAGIAGGTPLAAQDVDDRRAPAVDEDRFGGVVRARERAVLSAELDATVIDTPQREGEPFKAGDLLVELDCTLADAAHAQATARAEVAERDHESNEQLAGLDSVSDLQLAESAARLAEAVADGVASQHRVERCRVLAPFDGVVLRRDARRHERVQAGRELLEIASIDAHSVEFLVPSAHAYAVPLDRPFDFEVGETGERLEGRVTRVVPDVDPVSRTVKVIGELLHASAPGSPSAPLWPGMSGWVALGD